jgi:mRNA-degrading endonuclease RelE of RelBE toxin-antitoxin system
MPVVYEAAAIEALDEMPEKHRAQVVRHADSLATHPFPPGFKKLHGEKVPTYRVRSGKYCIIYVLRPGAGHPQVHITNIGDRKDVYRR